MGKRITLPSTIGDAENRLATLDALAVATGWERAAIVYTFTYEGTGGPRTVRVSGQLTIRQFADLKIKGLSNKDTVSFYRNNWKQAIASGDAADIGPGDKVTLPDLDWPAQEQNTGSRVSTNPQKAIQQVIQTHGPQVAAKAFTEAAPEAILDAVEESEPVKEEMTRRTVARHTEHRNRVVIRAKPLQDVADAIEDEYDVADTGTPDEEAQVAIRLALMVKEARIYWAMRGGKRSGDLANALAALEIEAHEWRSEHDGTAPVVITEEDQAWADEFGIDLGAVS